MDGNRAAVERFNDAFGRHDVDAVMAAVTDDCVFEDTTPPDGRRYEGRQQVRDCWEAFFRASPSASFTWEETVVYGDRATVRWYYQWGPDGPGGPGHVRGVDLLVLRGGRVAAKYSYVKG